MDGYLNARSSAAESDRARIRGITSSAPGKCIKLALRYVLRVKDNSKFRFCFLSLQLKPKVSFFVSDSDPVKPERLRLHAQL